VIREAKLVGFVILLAAIFLGAHVAGSHLGPVTTTHSQVSYPGMGGGGMGGMNMGGSGGSTGSGGQQVPPAVRLRGGRT
jgi:hypothetical protein